MEIVEQFISYYYYYYYYYYMIVHLVNRYELRKVEVTVNINICIDRSKGYSSLYFEEVPEHIKIGQKKYSKCVPLRGGFHLQINPPSR